MTPSGAVEWGGAVTASQLDAWRRSAEKSRRDTVSRIRESSKLVDGKKVPASFTTFVSNGEISVLTEGFSYEMVGPLRADRIFE